MIKNLFRAKFNLLKQSFVPFRQALDSQVANTFQSTEVDANTERNKINFTMGLEYLLTYNSTVNEKILGEESLEKQNATLRQLLEIENIEIKGSVQETVRNLQISMRDHYLNSPSFRIRDNKATLYAQTLLADEELIINHLDEYDSLCYKADKLLENLYKNFGIRNPERVEELFEDGEIDIIHEKIDLVERIHALIKFHANDGEELLNSFESAIHEI
mmetsp:Transcript_6868/g.6157  ORF Transcript_6868/g.6157 Transcript_6868/m.6157 type:complete len:217 (-) Transcript_6868:531-1181(-)